jgi:hypothetical protein
MGGIESIGGMRQDPDEEGMAWPLAPCDVCWADAVFGLAA